MKFRGDYHHLNLNERHCLCNFWKKYHRSICHSVLFLSSACWIGTHHYIDSKTPKTFRAAKVSPLALHFSDKIRMGHSKDSISSRSDTWENARTDVTNEIHVKLKKKWYFKSNTGKLGTTNTKWWMKVGICSQTGFEHFGIIVFSIFFKGNMWKHTKSVVVFPHALTESKKLTTLSFVPWPADWPNAKHYKTRMLHSPKIKIQFVSS